MAEEEKKKNHSGSVLKAFTKASLKYPVLLITVVISVILLEILGVVAPLYMRDFIDILSKGIPSEAVTYSLYTILIGYGVISLCSWVGRRFRDFSHNAIESKVMGDLSNDAFTNLIHHGHNFFISNFVGGLSRKANRYARSYEAIWDSIAYNFLPTLLFSIGSIWILYTRNVWLGTALLVWVVVFIAAQAVLTKWLQPLRDVRTKADTTMSGNLSDAISNHSSVALFAAEKFETNSFIASVFAWSKSMRDSWNAGSWVAAVQQAFAFLIEFGLLFIAVVLWNKGMLTVGDFFLIQIYVIGLVNRVWGIGDTLRRLEDAFTDASEMVDIMKTPHEIQDIQNAKELNLSKGEITFENVVFGFTKEKTILNDFSLTISGGEKVALVGSSGAGKSTITKLLLRLHDIQEGSISIDGQNIAEITQESLRSNISFVPQEPVLFHRSLKENIRYGKHDATDEEVIEAAKKAHCHEFIAGLPEGYDTLVGERGVKLSGGERQRVVIARAILKNAPILVLDEATSSLDSESEALIQDALGKLMQGKTVIAIAHRLSTIMKMDRIIVMEKGKAILSGTHTELLSQESNLYKKLWDIQAGGFVDNEEE